MNEGEKGKERSVSEPRVRSTYRLLETCFRCAPEKDIAVTLFMRIAYKVQVGSSAYLSRTISGSMELVRQPALGLV